MITKHFKSIYPILTMIEGGEAQGAMSPVLFVKEIAKEMELHVNAIGRVITTSEEVLQINEGTTHRHEITGHDLLVLGEYSYKHKKFKTISFWVDLGIGGMPIGVLFHDGGYIITKPYREDSRFMIKPDEEEIKALLNYVEAHPESVLPKKEEAATVNSDSHE